MKRLVGWSTGVPGHSHLVKVLRELDSGERITWECWFSHYTRQWVTRDGIVIGGILGWREMP